jgi:hypothetical protein
VVRHRTWQAVSYKQRDMGQPHREVSRDKNVCDTFRTQKSPEIG